MGRGRSTTANLLSGRDRRHMGTAEEQPASSDPTPESAALRRSVKGSRLDIADTDEREDGTVLALQAEITARNGDVLAEGTIETIDEPGDDSSYDNALLLSCEHARAKLKDRLAAECGIADDEAELIMDLEVNSSDMPAF